jgi:PAS domain S-box-containing protein
MMTKQESGQRTTDRLRVLVLADEQQHSDDVINFLQHSDLAAAEIVRVPGLEEAQAKLEKNTYDLVLVLCQPSTTPAGPLLEKLRVPAGGAPLLVLPEDLGRGENVAEKAETARASVARTNDATFLRSVRTCVAVGDLVHRRRVEDDTFRTLYSAIEQAADLVVITDSAGTIEYVNPAFEKLTGYTRLEVIGQTPRILKSGEQSSALYRDLWRTILSGEVYRGVLVNRKKSGESFIVEKTITPIRNPDGKVAHFISNDRDISERRRLEAALFQAQKMDAIGQLAGGVAHDFNNLLMVISSYAELMQDSIGPAHPLHRNVQEVLSAARRAADLTRQLLAFGRKQAQSLQVLDLNAVLRDISRMLPRLIGEDIVLTISPDAELEKVKLDPVQLEQVVMNLAANARDAMPQGGKLTIATRNVELDNAYVQARSMVPAGRYVLLEVTDSGQGIDAGHLPHIFEPFYTTKASGKGTGLGLATVYGIVKQSGGFVWVYSEPGMGTTFKIYFPRVEAGARKPVRADASIDPTALRGTETLLLVEDENAVRHPAVEFLRQCGYEVIEAKDGLQAVEAAHKYSGKIDMMITDVVMPGMSGGQLAELLADKYSDMKMLFVSGYSEQVVLRHKILDVQGNFLQKPFTLKSLAAKIREVLGTTAAAAAGK